MQESGLTEIIPLIMHLNYLGPVSCLYILNSSGLTVGSSCSPIAARWQVFVSFLSALKAHQLALEGCSWGWLDTSLFIDMAGNIPLIKGMLDVILFLLLLLPLFLGPIIYQVASLGQAHSVWGLIEQYGSPLGHLRYMEPAKSVSLKATQQEGNLNLSDFKAYALKSLERHN